MEYCNYGANQDTSLTFYVGPECNGPWTRFSGNILSWACVWNNNFDVYNDHIESFKVANFLTSTGGGAIGGAEQVLGSYCSNVD